MAGTGTGTGGPPDRDAVGAASGLMQDGMDGGGALMPDGHTLLDNSNAMDFAYDDDDESPPLDSLTTTFPQDTEPSLGNLSSGQPLQQQQPPGDRAKSSFLDPGLLSFDAVPPAPPPPPQATASFFPTNSNHNNNNNSNNNQDWFSSCIPDASSSDLRMYPIQAETTTSRHYSTLHPNSVVYTYYPYLTLDNLYNCMPQDVDFMEAEGCFHLPTRATLDQIVRQYFLHVHPLLPLLHEGDFWDMYYNRRGDGEEPLKMSLLVFQAIMFASCNVSLLLILCIQ